MKRVMTAMALLAVGGFVFFSADFGRATAGDKKADKVHMVGKDGLKIDSKITDDDKQFTYKVTLEGMDLELMLRHKSYKVKLDGGTKYKMTISAGDDEFDPLLVVFDDAGKILAYDDD